MNEGTAQPLDGRSLIRFERRYPHSMERVWAALTEPEQLRSGSARATSSWSWSRAAGSTWSPPGPPSWSAR